MRSNHQKGTTCFTTRVQKPIFIEPIISKPPPAWQRAELERELKEDEVIVQSGLKWIIRKKSEKAMAKRTTSQPWSPPSTNKATILAEYVPRQPPTAKNPRFGPQRDLKTGMKLATPRELRKVPETIKIRSKAHNANGRGKASFYTEKIPRPTKAFMCEYTKDKPKTALELLLEEILRKQK